jgi:cell division protein FtsQ
MKRKWIIGISWGLAMILLFALLVFTARRHDERRCEEVRISINRQGGDDFITEAEIHEYIVESGDSLEGRKMKDIDLHKLEQMICVNPYICSAHVYASLDGVVHVDVVQRKPIVRVQNLKDDPFYISDDGRLMPLNPGRPARVLFASGHFNYDIFSEYNQHIDLDIQKPRTKADTALMNTPLWKIFKIAKQIEAQPFLKAQMTQLVYDKSGDFALVPLVGSHLIIIGDEKDLDEKFSKLEAFYRKGITADGWEKYDTINLKFNKQVVCSLK